MPGLTTARSACRLSRSCPPISTSTPSERSPSARSAISGPAPLSVTFTFASSDRSARAAAKPLDAETDDEDTAPLRTTSSEQPLSR